MHALVIDMHAYAKLEALRAVAEANVTPFKTMQSRAMAFQARGGERTPEDLGEQDRTVMLRVGYSCTFTVEEHRPGIPCRHMSVSGPNQLPAPQAVEMLMEIMGFQNPLLVCKVWTEEVDGERVAVNVLEPVHEEHWKDLMTPVEGTVQ